MRTKASGNPSSPGVSDSTKGRIHWRRPTAILLFTLATLRRTIHVWSRGVTRWFRCSLSVADPFVCRCLTSCTMLPSSHPAHRTGRACFRHPALGESFTRSPTGNCSPAWKGRRGPALRAGMAPEIVWPPAIPVCAWHTTTEAAYCVRVDPPPDRLC